MIKHVIVTGGIGVTGNALVKYLLQQNIEVTALVRPNSFRRCYLPEEHPLLQVVECGMESYGQNGERLSSKQYDVFRSRYYETKGNNGV